MTDVSNPTGLRGLAFVEWSSATPADLQNLFFAFGFSRTHRHRNLAVDYFVQNDIHFFLNTEPGAFAENFHTLHGPSISALGFRCDNASAAFEEAVRRGARPYEGKEGKTFLDAPAVYGIGNSSWAPLAPGVPNRRRGFSSVCPFPDRTRPVYTHPRGIGGASMATSLSELEIPLFQGVDAAALGGQSARLRRLAPWELLFNQHDTSRDVHFLLSGTLAATFHTEGGREVIFTQINPGDYFGELAALDGGARSLAVMAKTPAELATLTADQFRALIDQSPLVCHRITEGLVARIRSLTQRTLELTAFSVEQRVVSFLASLAIERDQFRAGGVIDDAPTHAEIAASVGANREMVSRIMTRLGKRGLLRSARKRIEILAPDLLTQEL